MTVLSRKHGAIVATLPLVLLAACGGSGSPSDGDGPITIGLLAPITGPAAQGAQQVRNVVDMTVAQINEDGGIDGRDLEIKVYDTQLTPEVAVTETQRAVTQDKVCAVLGPWSSGEGIAVAQTANQMKTVNIHYSAVDPRVTEGNDYVFRVASRTPEYTGGLVEMAVALDVKKAAVLVSSGGFGQGAKEPLEDAADELGVDTTFIQFTENSDDLTAEVARAAQGDPEAVFILGSAGSDNGLVGKAMVEQGLDVPVFGTSPIMSPDSIAIGGEAFDQLPGAYTVQTLETTKPGYETLLSEYNQEHDTVLSLPEQASQVVDVLHWLRDGLEASGGQCGEDLVDGLEQLGPREGLGGRVGSQQEFTSDDHDAYDEDYLVPYKIEKGMPVQDESLQLGG